MDVADTVWIFHELYVHVKKKMFKKQEIQENTLAFYI